MIERTLSRVWDQLRGQKVQRAHFLEDVRIRGLRGDGPPEAWIWARLGQYASEYAQAFGVDEAFLSAELGRLQDLFEPAADKPAVKEKERFHTLCTGSLNRETRTVARAVGQAEARRGELYEVTQAIEMAVHDWRLEQARP